MVLKLDKRMQRLIEEETGLSVQDIGRLPYDEVKRRIEQHTGRELYEEGTGIEYLKGEDGLGIFVRDIGFFF